MHIACTHVNRTIYIWYNKLFQWMDGWKNAAIFAVFIFMFLFFIRQLFAISIHIEFFNQSDTRLLANSTSFERIYSEHTFIYSRIQKRKTRSNILKAVPLPICVCVFSNKVKIIWAKGFLWRFKCINLNHFSEQKQNYPFKFVWILCFPSGNKMNQNQNCPIQVDLFMKITTYLGPFFIFTRDCEYWTAQTSQLFWSLLFCL